MKLALLPVHFCFVVIQLYNTKTSVTRRGINSCCFFQLRAVDYEKVFQKDNTAKAFF